MAQVKISLAKVRTRALSGGLVQVPESRAAAQTLQSSAASQQSTLQGVPGSVWTVAAIGGAVHVAFGANPVAGSATGFLVPAGAVMTFGVADHGEKCAVKDL